MKKQGVALICALLIGLAGCKPAQTTAATTVPVTTATSTTVTTTEIITTVTSTTVETTTAATTTSTTVTTTKRPTTTTIRPTTTTTTTTETTTTETTTTETTTTTSIPTTTTTSIPTTTTTTVPVETIRIYIDQGHNPHSFNTGASGNGLREQDVTFTVGVLLMELLEQDPRFEVRLSRPTADTLLGTDNTSSLKARTDDANAWGADYFISIHCNAYAAASANGVEAYAYATGGEGFALGSAIVDALVAETGFHKRGMKVDSSLYVLRNTTMPAVLVEIGFITNATEAAMMASDPGRFARGIYSGIVAYLPA